MVFMTCGIIQTVCNLRLLSESVTLRREELARAYSVSYFVHCFMRSLKCAQVDMVVTKFGITCQIFLAKREQQIWSRRGHIENI